MNSNNNTFIIAEAGVNHNGDLNIAKRLIDVAIEAGADAIKFQTFKAQNLVTSKAEKANYQMQDGKNNSQYSMLKDLELSYENHMELLSYTNKNNLIFMSSGFDLESNSILNSLGLEIYKIPSGEINNLQYLRQIGSFQKKTILSTGISTLGEIEKALEILVTNGCKLSEIIVLHCNSEYPTPFKHVNLRAMLTIKNAFNVEVGYSDHTIGIEVPIAAVALGAKVIEKHLTLDNKMPGPDHKASIEPKEFINMVRCIRNVEKSLGSTLKIPSPSEIENKVLIRKSIVASKRIKPGEMFDHENITFKRPGSGLSPMLIDELIGKISTKEYQKDDLIFL